MFKNNLRYYTTGLLSLFGALTVMAQQPDASVQPAATPAAVPAAYVNPVINYVRTREPNMPLKDPALVTASARTVQEVKQTTQYFDGLGRLLQTVTKGISPGLRDLVSPVVYDDFGREEYKYLPYVPQSGNVNDGNFKTDPFNSQKAFYQTAALNTGAAGESVYYSQTDYEASPLNRVYKTYAPGNSWSKTGGNKPVESQYLINTAADAVRVWNISSTSTIPVSTGTYGVGQLDKSVTKDEHGARIVEFRDKDEHVVLKRVEMATGSADGHTGWLCTYFVYDDFGNIRCVIPPKAVELITAGWVISQAIADGLCFQYQYDGNNRVIYKKLPGALPVETVYDLRDRPVFTQDGNLKSDNQWLVTFYDGRNRAVMTALYNSTATRATLQASMNTVTSSSQPLTYNIPGIVDLVRASHDGRALYKARNSIVFEPGFEVTGGDVLAEIDPASTQEVITVGVSNPLPGIAASALTPLTYTFYDNYTYSGAHAALTTDFNKPQAGPYAELLTAVSSRTQGLVTGTKTKVLGTNNEWLTTTTYYNDKARVIQAVSDNISGGKDVVTNLYDFNGKLLSTYKRHNNRLSGTTPQTTVRTTLAYDHAGRLTTAKKSLNDITAQEKTIVENTYDELGRLRNKRLGVTSSGQLEILTYDYNIHSWLKAINKGFVTTAGSTANWFGEELAYDFGFTAKQHNGNIAGAKWKTRGDGLARAYGYAYDRASRLTIADYTQQNAGSTSWTRDKMDFSVSGLAYDANGNISSMTQKGMVGTAITVIDQLGYSYQPNTNRLAAVTDPSGTAPAKLGDFINGVNTGDDYAYDDNANLTKDENKKISAITYNHLNLPEGITITGKGTIRYLYDANGVKHRKIVTDNTVTPAKITTTDYISGFVYENNTQQFFGHEEGRIRAVARPDQALAYEYDYFVKDHLDNTRLVLTQQTDFALYTATMETGKAAQETALFSNLEETRAPKPVGYPQSNNGPAENAFVAKLNAKTGGKKIGPSLVIKVMAGDTVQIGTNAFYKSQGPGDTKRTAPLEDMVAGLLQAFGGNSRSAGTHNATAGPVSPFAGNFSANDYQRLKEKDPGQNISGKPRAYLNYVLFDDQFNMIEDNSGVRQVKGEADQLQVLTVDKMAVKKTGFLYVYTSNETEQDVFFDNLTIMSIAGPLLEETHYYPFGLTMSGISSNALKGTAYPENRIKYNGKELQNNEFRDGSGLEWYDYGARLYDQQLGRWHKTDDKAELYYATSPYVYALNQPVNAVDPDGNLVIFVNGNYYFRFSAPGASYWQTTTREKIGERYAGQKWGEEWYTPVYSYKPLAFDKLVMNQLDDHAPPRYYDGSIGGWHPLGDLDAPQGAGRGSATAEGRAMEGYLAGKRDAASIIANLARDKNNNITETIKVITHSMGGAYGKGLVRALKDYIKEHHLEQQVKITLVADFDPYQAGDLKADPDIKTMQFIHKNFWNIFGMGWLANDREKGDVETPGSRGSSSDHSIFTFIADISQLEEGTYKWNGSKWVKQ
jgi:RHS repeat-associated protein